MNSLAEKTTTSLLRQASSAGIGEFDTTMIHSDRTTTFVEDANVNTAEGITQHVDNLPIIDQSMRDFFAKPQLIGSVSWTTASASGASLVSGGIAGKLVSNTVWSNKYAGFNLVRGTAVLRVQVNANPFQAGKIYVSYLPMGTQMYASNVPLYTARTLNLAALRQLPGVELSCRETTAVLKIPFIAPADWYDIKTNNYDWGDYFIHVLSPLRTGASGQTAVDLNMYLSWEDFEMAAPSIPQGPRSKKRFASKTFKRPPSEEEVQKLGDGPVSNALSTISTMAGSVSGIPGISAVAGPVSWATRVMSRLAGALGYAKPNILDTPHYMVRQYNHFFPNCDGADPSFKLAATNDNKVELLEDIYPSGADEMSLDFLFKVSTITRVLSWTTSNAVGTSLFHELIGPQQASSYISGTKGHAVSNTYRSGAPFFYLSNLFGMWRGSIRLVLKIVKTDFHSGRIAIVWTPTQTLLTAPVYNGSAQYALREIVDIREGDEICLDLPYLQAVNYLKVGSASGQLDITVLNVLRAPETCSSTVEILMYLSGGPDYELAAPCPSPIQPFIPQVGELVCEGIGGLSVKENIRAAMTSVGEKILSIRQLLARPTQVYRSVADANVNAWYMWPWFISLGTENAATGAFAPPTFGGDMYCFLAPMYAVARGSVRLTDVYNQVGEVALAANIPNTSLATMYGASSTIIPVFDATLGKPATAATLNAAWAIQDSNTNMIAVDVPYYNLAKCHLNDVVMATNNLGVTTNIPNSLVGFGFRNNTYNNIWRSIGEDFQFGLFLGCPPLLLSSV